MKRLITFASVCCASVISFHSASADVRDGLVAYWPLDVLTNDVNSGMNISPDLGPNGNHLSDNFTMTSGDVVAGIRGSAVSFDGAAKYLSQVYAVGEGRGLPVYDARYYTVSFWVKGIGATQQARAVFAEANNANNNPFFRLTTDWASSGRTNVLAAAIRNDSTPGNIGARIRTPI